VSGDHLPYRLDFTGFSLSQLEPRELSAAHRGCVALVLESSRHSGKCDRSNAVPVWTGKWSLQVRHPQGTGFSSGIAVTFLRWHSGHGYGFLTEVNAGPGSCAWSVLIGDRRCSRGALSLGQHPVGAVLEVAAAAARQVAVSRGHLRAAPRARHRSSAESGDRFTSKGTLQPEFHPHPPTGTGGVGSAAGQLLPGPVVRNNSWSTRLSEPSINEMSSRPTVALPAPGRECGVLPRISSPWSDSFQIQRRFSPK